MKIEEEKELKTKYPLFLKDLHETTIYQSCLGFGIECGSGWYHILDEAFAKIEPILQKWDGDKDYFPKAAQIKEKFGSLRIYTNGYCEEIEAIVRDAEIKSQKTCEQCGKPGTYRGKGWIYVSCEDCENEREKERERRRSDTSDEVIVG